ncbi:putative glycine-rich cell wall structural protein 1 [Prosopis cineraria]|uniref:putative glycine-rich cell wall structural protein 1 n=1 Tax=Prosopis cineraria TaxID=364024 RepID=UPI00240ED19C|nr:putative glycine-rich cell wall structural protein 1 [Prosopis cineraria]
MKITIATFVFLVLLFVSSFGLAARPASDRFKGSSNKGGGGDSYGGVGGFFGPGSGFIPGFGKGFGDGTVGGGYGAGYGGPNGGYSKGGVIRPSVVCKEKGPCYQKKVTCPAKCFSSFSHSGKGYGSGGGGGGCTIDCKKKCTASC